MRIEEDGCSLSIYIDIKEKSIYLADFYSVYPNMGIFTDFLKKHIELLKQNYPSYLIYADCNAQGTGAAIKAGGRVKEILNRITF